MHYTAHGNSFHHGCLTLFSNCFNQTPIQMVAQLKRRITVKRLKMMKRAIILKSLVIKIDELITMNVIY